jgi:hypothetical protein
VSSKLPFTAIYRVKQITVYSNLPCQSNYRLQQFTVSRKLPLTAIYRVKKITVYSNLLCQANYSLQQFTVSKKLALTTILIQFFVVDFFNGHTIFRDKFDRTIGFECGYGV